jgi:hypothetical protein
MTPLEHKGQFDSLAPFLRLVCPSCGSRLPRTARATWSLCHCLRAPLLPSDLGSTLKPADERELQAREWRRGKEPR